MDHWLCAKKRILLALVCCTLFPFQTTAVSAGISTVRCGNREQKKTPLPLMTVMTAITFLPVLSCVRNMKSRSHSFPSGTR